MTSKNYLNLPKTSEQIFKDLEDKIDNLNFRLSELENRLPKSFDIFYKPPHQEKHQKLHLSLDDIYARINRIERQIEQ